VVTPGVVFQRVAADEEASVDRPRPAEHLAAHPEMLLSVRVHLGLGHERPGIALVPQDVGDEHGDADVQRVVAAAGFDQKNVMVRIFTEPVREDTARRARTDDDVVVCRARFERLGVH
jgi:hypothetical protein